MIPTGFIDSPYRAKDYDFGLHDVFGSSPVGNEKFLTDHVRNGKDQLHTQSCTAMGTDQVIWINQGTFGVPDDVKIFPSDLAAYYQGRAIKWGYENIFDIGSALHNVWEGHRQYGMMDDKDYPFDLTMPGKPGEGPVINRCPPRHLYREASDNDWLKYRWVLDPPGSRSRRIRQTLDNNRALTLAVEVDGGFEQWQLSHGPWRRTSKAKGSHLMAIFGYEFGLNGGVWCANSHGAAFGEGGYILVAWDYIENPECRGFSTAEFDMQKLDAMLRR